MADEKYLDGISEEEFDEISESGMFIEIPTRDGIPREGDMLIATVEAIDVAEKSANSFQLTVSVVDEGVNYGKTYKDIYPPLSKGGLGILKQVAGAFGATDEFFEKKDGKIAYHLEALIGKRAKLTFHRTWTEPQDAGKEPILRATAGATDLSKIPDATSATAGVSEDEPPF